MHPMVEHAMVSVATGVLSPLLSKLSSLVEKEYAQLKGVRKEIISMRDELRSMYALLVKLAAEDDPDVQVKEWRNQIRDLSYDIEDCIDDFMRRVELGHGNNEPPDGYLRKIFANLKTLGARHDIAQKIRELKDRVDDVSKRHSRYAFEGASSSSAAATAVPIDARLLATYARPGSLVGIDGPREEIIKLLHEEGEPGKRLKVVSITGFGGLGKTTLAYEVLRELGDQFDFQVTVVVSQSPDITKILTKILSQVKERPPHLCNISDEQELITELRSHLLAKRYFIIIDDIWDPLVWEVIRVALPDNNLGSRVITTTRVQSIAATCCMYRHEDVYKMKPLNDEDSRRLFFQRIFGTEDHCPGELKEVSSQILRKCGGLPLAIVVISSLLASQATKVKEYWEYVQSSMDSNNVGTDGGLDVMRQILNLSYRNLSPHLKTCFVYLGAYPEDCVIWRDDLVRQWVAEGFVEAVDVAGSCFNELVNRSMIQPEEMGYNGEPVACKVHDMMLDLVIRKYSADENFMTVIDHSQEKVKGSSHSVRRLVHHSDSSDNRRREMRLPLPAVSIDLSKVRSFSTWGSTQIPNLSRFKFIRVLSLELLGTRGPEETMDLTAICKLFQLRYLMVTSEVELMLPTQIRALQHLGTLEIAVRLSSAGIALPSDVAQLPCLSYLSILPHMTSLPDGISGMRCLRSLASFVLEEDSLDKVRALRHLTNLNELYLRLPIDECFVDAAEARVDVLCSSLPEHGGCRLYVNAWSRNAWFPGVPQWICRLDKLYSLELGIGELSTEGVALLAGLPALVHLDLWVRARGTPSEHTVITGAGFPVLQHLILTCRALRLSFEPGAMPSLQSLKLEFNAAAADGDVVEHQGGGCGNALTGVEHLLGLKDIYASIGGIGTATATEDSGTRTAAVSALRDAIGLHPSRPRLRITTTRGRYGYPYK